MATQTIEIKSEHPNEADTVCRAYNPTTGDFVQASATLAAPMFGVIYFAIFTDLPAGEYFFMLESSTGEELTYGYATVTLTTATFKLSGVKASEQPALATALAALRGADNDTLKTLSDQIDLISSGGGSLTQGDIDSIVAAITAVADNIQQAQAGILTAYEYTTWSQDIEDLVALTSNTDIIFVLKRRMQDADAQALLKVSRVNGLMILNGVNVSSSRSDEASITVNQSTPTGEITLLVESTAMAEVPRGKWIDGLKMLHASGDVILRQGTTIIRESAVDETS